MRCIKAPLPSMASLASDPSPGEVGGEASTAKFHPPFAGVSS